ncbi:hypothetical protein FXO38_27274 [Capsicum annuum]|nr:hypothetical protein FXO37_34447 [Capsicum annuum]KAF3630244.1 hypothetical protein FXO38_27274 [Capsicum annuum]
MNRESGPSFSLGVSQLECFKESQEVVNFVPGDFDYEIDGFHENRSKHRNDPQTMKKLHQKLAKKDKKKESGSKNKGDNSPESKAPVKRRRVVEEICRDELPKELSYVIKEIPSQPLRFMLELCSNVESKVAVKEGNNIPHILNWKVVAVRPQFNQFMIEILSKYSYANIVPTADEFEKLDLARTSFASEHHDMKEKSKVDADSTSTLNKKDLVVKADLYSLESEIKAYMKTYIDQKFKDLERLMNAKFTEVLNSLEQKNKIVKHETIVKQIRQEFDPLDVVVDDAGPTSTNSVVKETDKPVEMEDDKANQAPSFLKKGEQHEKDVGIEKQSDIAVEEIQPLGSIITGREHDLTLTIYKPPPTTPTEYEISDTVFCLPFLRHKRMYTAKDLATQDASSRTDKVTDMEKSLINTIKGLSTCAGQSWHMVNEKVPTDWTALKSYEEKSERDPFQVEYVSEITQQDSGSLDCGVFVIVYAEYLSEGLGIACSGTNSQYHCLRYPFLLCKYGYEKVENGYFS